MNESTGASVVSGGALPDNMAIYSWETCRPIDVAVSRVADGQVIGLYSGQTVQELSGRYGDCVVMTMDDAFEHQSNAACRPLEPCTEEHYMEMLEVLPPLRWVNEREMSSFRVGECCTGDVYTAMVRIRVPDGYRFFKGRKRIGTTHSELVVEALKLIGGA